MNQYQTNKQSEEYIEVISALGESPKIGPVPADLVFPWAVIICICFILGHIILSVSLVWFFSLSVWFCGAWWVLTGSKSYEFTDRLVPLPGKEYINANTLFVPATDVGSFKRKMAHKTKPINVKTPNGKTEKLVPFQVESNLHAIMEIEIADDKFAVLLKCDGDDNWSATIPFALTGIHPELYETEIDAHASALTEALKDIPKNESLTIMLGCRSKSRQRLNDLEALSQQSQHQHLPSIDLILESEKNRTQKITKSGFRQEWSQYIFATWTRNQQSLRKESDLLGKTMNWLNNVLGKKARILTNTEEDRRRNTYIQLAQEIYENGYYPWKITLGTKAELNFRCLQATEIWSDLLWYRFNSTPTPEIPQLVSVVETAGGLDYQVFQSNPDRSKDTISVLLEGERGRSSCPKHYGRRDLISVNSELIAAMSLETAPSGWLGRKDQLRWIWQQISDTNVRDTEVCLEINPGDKDLAHENLIKLSKQSTAANLHAFEDGSGLDVKATLKQGEAIEAQKRLHQGAQPLFAALTVLVYRQSEAELQRACAHLSNSFGTAKLIRETKVCWKLWSETLPINSQKQLKTTALFTERRSTLDTTSIVGLLPITKPKDIHRSGLELIYREGGYPIHIDLFANSERAIVTGKSGSGKSVISFGFIKHALAQGIKVVGMDMSNSGESTFELVTNLLGDRGAYINIIEHSFNLLQPPDLRKFAPKKRSDRLRIWKNFTRQVLVSMAMGQIDDPELKERVDGLIVKLLNIFLRERTILERYNQAFDGGWKSLEWKNMPTLHDLLFFCSREKLELHDFGEIESRAINQINNQISAKLEDPNIGDAIGKPSSIPPDPAMKFFALSGLTNENNAYLMALVAQMACLNTALEHPRSLLVMDECSVLFDKKGFAEIVGERFATGRKEGQSVLIIGQDIDAIANSRAASKIFTNTDVMMTGKTTSDAAKTYTRVLNFPPKIINKNAADTFAANSQYLYTHWLVSKDNRFWDCLYFPSIVELSILANSQEEKAARNRILAKYPNTLSGKIKASAEFAYHYGKFRMSGRDISDIGIGSENSEKNKYDELQKQIAA